MVSVFGNGIEIRASNKAFVKREKLQNKIKLKWKTKSNNLENDHETDIKRYKPSIKSNNERRSSKVEFKPQLVC